MEIISAKEAKRIGAIKYFTGKACINGHTAERYTKSWQCCDCESDRSKNWAANNRDKQREAGRRHRRNNPDSCRKSLQKYRHKNKQKVTDMRREWRKNYSHVSNYHIAKYRAMKKQAIPSWFSEFDAFAIREAARLAKERKLATGIEWHVDHLIPLSCKKACGLHVAVNIQVIPRYLNITKSNKLILTDPFEWLACLQNC